MSDISGAMTSCLTGAPRARNGPRPRCRSTTWDLRLLASAGIVPNVPETGVIVVKRERTVRFFRSFSGANSCHPNDRDVIFQDVMHRSLAPPGTEVPAELADPAVADVGRQR